MEANIWMTELRAILRGAAGSFLFGVPLLYTLEIWSIGSSTEAPLLLIVLGTTFIIVLLLTQIEGFRRTLQLRPLEAVLESIEALGIGMICALLALVLLRRITLVTPMTEALGKLVFESVPFSLGVTLARSTLTRPNRNRRRVSLPQRFTSPTLISLRDTLIDIDATLIGAILIAFSIAPTEEIQLIASALPPLWLLLIVAASLLLSYSIVFASGFTDRSERQQRGLLLSPLSETLVTYLVVLLASMLMLIFFQQLNFQEPWQEWLGDTLVLGLPASVGGAAGRLLI
ncbi:TIGR02587 family membrane protein [Romeria aff. gracilis LEGE 07310]|uniref:TIGR02587 family membrane protein n=1 Tax=Vasconcelosia minhoensis LEGE 07310 TaxID=915328 RepID=A0A8J7AG57_9CYAN|nr:TIGR02587 family membrane protein [Romeria gracilis]MBE9078551.1 TIGR02587 family membrane protein [Romeria aff. gracilis LEGE 07310]